MKMTSFRSDLMRGAILNLCAVVLLALLAAVPVVAAKPAVRSCQTAGTTVAANEHLRLFQQGQTLTGSGLKYWACPGRAGRPRYLTSASWEADRLPVALGGRFAIFSRRRCTSSDDRNADRSTCRGGVAIYDARRNSIRYTPIARDAEGVLPFVLSFGVNANGWSAWVAVDANHYADQAVWLMAPGRAPRQVAQTTSGSYSEAFDAVAINGRRVFWSVGDATGSQQLR
jgi:hypothetical protein